MGGLKPQDFQFEQEKKETISEDRTVVEERQRVMFATEDIIAVFAGLVVIVFAIAMVAGSLPVNKLTIGVLGFSGTGAVIAQIIKAKWKTGIAKKGTGENR